VSLSIQEEIKEAIQNTIPERVRPIQERIGALWTAGEGLETTFALRSVERFKDAWNEAEAARAAQDDWTLDELTALDTLIGRAKSKYDEIRQRHEFPVTKQEGEIVFVVLDFVALLQQVPEAQVTYFASEEPKADPKAMLVSEAAKVARRRLVMFWEKKVGEYLDTAQGHLDRHKPRLAEAAVRDCETLPGRYDERLGVSFPSYLETRIGEMQKKIRPELEKLRTAETKLAQARASNAPLEAHQYWTAAKNGYPHVDGLDEVRQQIVTKAWQEVNLTIPDIKTRLEREEWQPAQQKLAYVSQLLTVTGPGEAPEQNELQKKVASLQNVYEQILPVIDLEAGRLHGEEERRHLEMLQQQYQDGFWSFWHGLQTRLRQLQARHSVAAIQKEINDTCNPEATIQALAQLNADVAEMAQNPPAGLSNEDKKALSKFLARLEGWLGFARARDEWRKVKVSRDADDDEELELTDVPDLAVMRQGVEAAQKDSGAARAASNLSLADRLGSLEHNDERANQAMQEARRLLDKNEVSAEQLRRQKTEIERWLRRPTSCRRDLLAIRSQVAQHLSAALRQQIETQLDDAQPWFEDLALEDVTRQRLEYQKVSVLLPDEGDEAFEQEVDTAVAIATAHRTEREARRGMMGWKSVKERWETAREEALPDSDLRDYAHRRSRFAFKQQQMQEARAIASAQPEGAERLLRQLIEDPVLQEDWEVWYEHGKQIFQLARRRLNPNHHLFSEVTPAIEYLGQARTSLNRASATARQQDIPADKVSDHEKLGRLLADLEEWDQLVETLDFAAGTLLADGLVTHEDSHQALARKQEAEGAISQRSEPSRWLKKHWQAVRQAAQERLEEQFREATGDFLRLDSLLALIAFFPNDETIKTRLQDLVLTTISDVQREVANIAGDDAAAKFLERYRRQHDGHVPENRQLAQLQLEETAQAGRKVRTLRLALDMKQLDTVQVSPASLNQEKESLDRWAEALRGLQIALDSAWRIAENGLRQPEQFERAYYILRQNNRGSVDLPQVPENFKNRNHPSYRWCSEAIEELEGRYKAQKVFYQEIVARLDQEKEAAKLALAVRNDDELSAEDMAKVNELPQLLAELQARMAAMREAEPDDPTRLQTKMKYEPTDENQRYYYRGLANIATVIGCKLEQYLTLKRWLEQFSIGEPSPDGRHPAIVDWQGEKPEIFRQRDSGPSGLVEARKRCHAVREGDEAGIYNGLWSMVKARVALSFPALMNYLQQQAVGEDAVAEREPVLYGVCEPLNQRRTELEKRLAQQIAENQATEDNIRWRHDTFNERWQRFINAQQALMKARKPPWRQWLETAAWETFRQAIEAFCQICPAYPGFRQGIQEVAEKTGGLEARCEELPD
jgi:hypothetical protein